MYNPVYDKTDIRSLMADEQYEINVLATLQQREMVLCLRQKLSKITATMIYSRDTVLENETQYDGDSDEFLSFWALFVILKFVEPLHKVVDYMEY